MIIFRGKAKNMTFKMLLYIFYWTLARPVEQLEPADFNLN